MIKVDFKEVGYYVICILFIVVAGNIFGITKTFSYDAISNTTNSMMNFPIIFPIVITQNITISNLHLKAHLMV